LTGSAGTGVVGRLQTAAYDWGVAYDPLAGSAVSALQQVNYQASYGILGATAGHAPADNAIAYISPSFGGLTFAVNQGVAVAESAVSGADQAQVNATLISATFVAGPLSVGAVADRQYSSGAGATESSRTDAV
jgi:predicted porin